MRSGAVFLEAVAGAKQPGGFSSQQQSPLEVSLPRAGESDMGLPRQLWELQESVSLLCLVSHVEDYYGSAKMGFIKLKIGHVKLSFE